MVHRKNSIAIVIAGLCAFLATYYKISYAVGAGSYFSLAAMVMPLLGVFGGLSSMSLFLLCKMMWRIVQGLALCTGTTFYLPSWCAAWALSSYNDKRVWYGVPLLAIILFVIHPVGSQAWLYSMYWLIPIYVMYAQSSSIYARMLGATFIAHAVGSLIWLYMVPMTAAQWLGLIPLVALERITYAAGMGVLYYAIVWMSRYCAQIRLPRIFVYLFSKE